VVIFNNTTKKLPANNKLNKLNNIKGVAIVPGVRYVSLFQRLLLITYHYFC